GRACLPRDPVAPWRTGGTGQPDESGRKSPDLQPGTTGRRHRRTHTIISFAKKTRTSAGLFLRLFRTTECRAYRDASHSCVGAYHQELVTGRVNSSSRSRMPSPFMPYMLRNR